MASASALPRTTSGLQGKQAAARVAGETPWVLTPRRKGEATEAAAAEPDPRALVCNSGRMGRNAARRVISRPLHFSRRGGPVEETPTLTSTPPRFKDIEGEASSSTKRLIEAEEAKAAAMAHKLEQLETASMATVKSSQVTPSADQVEYERMVEKANAMVAEADQARAEAAANSAKYWKLTEDPCAYDPTSRAEQFRRLNEYRAFLAEQNHKNLKSLRAGESPVLARQKSEQMKVASDEAKRKEWRQKEKDKANVLLDELATVDSKITQLRTKGR